MTALNARPLPSFHPDRLLDETSYRIPLIAVTLQQLIVILLVALVETSINPKAHPSGPFIAYCICLSVSIGTSDNPSSGWIEGVPTRPSFRIPSQAPISTNDGHSFIPATLISPYWHPPGMDAGHDSLVTVRLSEPPILTVDTALAEAHEQQPLRPVTMMSPHDSPMTDTSGAEATAETATPRDSLARLSEADASRTLEEELGTCAEEDESRPSFSSEEQDEVNWEQLEKTEDEQTKDEETDNVSPSFSNQVCRRKFGAIR